MHYNFARPHQTLDQAVQSADYSGHRRWCRWPRVLGMGDCRTVRL